MNLTVTLDADKYMELFETLKASPAIMARALKSGLSSAGFHMRKKLVGAVKENKLGWPELRRHTPTGRSMTPWLSTHRPPGFNRITSNGQLFGRLTRILRYQYESSPSPFVKVGILTEKFGEKVGKLARLFQEGKPNFGAVFITPQMRRYFAAAGIPFKRTTTQLSSQPRPLFGPVYDQEIEIVKSLVFTVIADKLTNGFAHRDILDKAVGMK